MTIQRVLWASVVVLTAVGVIRSVEMRAAIAAPELPPSLPRSTDAPLQPQDWDVPGMLETLTEGDLFDVARSLPGVAGVAMTETPAIMIASRPALVLRGIVGGPPWSVLLEGIPGTPGPVVLTRRDTSGGLSLQAVRHDTAFIKGPDTTWALTLPGQ